MVNNLIRNFAFFLKEKLDLDYTDDKDIYKRYNLLSNKFLINNDYDNLLLLENVLYSNYIKKKEDQKSYQKFLKINNQNYKFFDLNYLNYYKNFNYLIKNYKGEKNKIVFFFHNSLSDRAHVEHLFYFLERLDKNYYRNKKIHIFAIGEQLSDLIKKFCKNKKIKVYLFNGPIYETFVNILKTFLRNKYSKIILNGVPVYLSLMTTIFPKKTVIWYSHKFPVYNLKEVDKVICPIGFKNKVNVYPESGLFLNIKKENNNVIDFKKIIFFSINREEKMYKKAFLNLIVNLLEKYPDSIFRCTAGKEGPLYHFFKEKNLLSRIDFLGKFIEINYKKYYGNFYIDSSVLSGSVAMKMFINHIPVIYFSETSFTLNLLFKKFIKITFPKKKFLNILKYYNFTKSKNYQIELNKQIDFVQKIKNNIKFRKEYFSFVDFVSQKVFIKKTQINNTKKLINLFFN